MTAQESQYDVGIIGFTAQIGEQVGEFGIDPNGASGYYNLTGFPGKYFGPGGAQMTNDFGYATVNANYSVFNYGNFEINPGNSGGPLWYDQQAGHMLSASRLRQVGLPMLVSLTHKFRPGFKAMIIW